MQGLFGARSNASKELHKIYLRSLSNNGVIVEREIEKLAAGDAELFDELVTKYYVKYGVTPQASSTSGYVYFLKAQGFYGVFSGIYGRYKIGLSNNVQRRLTELNGQQAPCPIVLKHYIEVNNMKDTEGRLHSQYKSSRKHGEWFDFFIWELPFIWLQYQHYARASKRQMIKPIPLELVRVITAVLLVSFLGASAFSMSSGIKQESAPVTRGR